MHLARFRFVYNILYREIYVVLRVMLLKENRFIIRVSRKTMASNEPGFHISSCALSDLDDYPVCGSIRYLQTPSILEGEND